MAQRSAPVLSFPVPSGTLSLDDPSLYVNRELSLLQFQWRVLEEARDPANPLLERVKFLAIVGSNLDEFFMVRVAGLKNQVDAGIYETGADGMSAVAQLRAIRQEYHRLSESAHECRRRIFAELAEQGIRVLQYGELAPEQKFQVDQYFAETIYPVLTPLAVDPGRPFPHISNLSLNIAVLIRDEDGDIRFARLKVPDSLPQLMPLQNRAKPANRVRDFVWLEQVIQANLPSLFPGMEIEESHMFHVTRDADLDIQELEADDLLETIEQGVRQRRFGAVVRLEVNAEMPESIVEILEKNLGIDEADVYRVPGPLSLVRLRGLSVDRPDLKDSPFQPAPLMKPGKEEDLFAIIRRGDVMLHHPFDSFQPVVDFLRAAANDANVMAIKVTLYRVGRNSPVVEALLEAMRRGKQVTVLVELKARFDEESNIEWARALEDEGVHVVYGLVGLKIHAKVCLVVRREGDVIRRYVHLSTGNYSAVTAHLYTDIGLFTCDPDIGADASDLFNYLTGYSAKRSYRKLLVAPVSLRDALEELVRREIEHVREGREGHLVFKTNALADARIIRLLYEASKAGVKVDLIVRGICCLRPGIPELSENIRVRSIVGRFLEHSRIYYFRNGGDEQIYLGSADLMSRNIDRRVEVLFPIETPAMLAYIRDRVLSVYQQDNLKARLMLWDGSYQRIGRLEGEEPVSAQQVLMRR